MRYQAVPDHCLKGPVGRGDTTGVRLGNHYGHIGFLCRVSGVLANYTEHLHAPFPGKLDGSDQVRTSLSFEQIDRELDQVRKGLRREAKRLAKSNKPLDNKQGRYYAFLADPSFTEQYDDRSGVLLLTSEFLTYRTITTEVRRSGIVDQIRELTDWQAKLNHLLHGSLPPYPRLAVNAALAKRNRVAKEIHLTLSTAKQPVQIRAKHELTLGLRKEHYRRIATTRQQLKDFDSIAFNEFLRRSAKTASRKRAKRR